MGVPRNRTPTRPSSTQVPIEVLERLARNAALEQRLLRERLDGAHEAAAAVERVTVHLAALHGIEVTKDDRGDRWAMLDGHRIAHLGYDPAAEQQVPA